jgi:hypothetical protein
MRRLAWFQLNLEHVAGVEPYATAHLSSVEAWSRMGEEEIERTGTTANTGTNAADTRVLLQGIGQALTSAGARGKSASAARCWGWSHGITLYVLLPPTCRFIECIINCRSLLKNIYIMNKIQNRQTKKTHTK